MAYGNDLILNLESCLAAVKKSNPKSFKITKGEKISRMEIMVFLALLSAQLVVQLVSNQIQKIVLRKCKRNNSLVSNHFLFNMLIQAKVNVQASLMTMVANYFQVASLTLTNANFDTF